MRLKLKVLPLITVLVSLCCAGFLGYRGYQWWQKHQKRKALFLYLQKKSPVTRRIPSDAFFYANLYDLKRVHDQLKGTNLYQVLAHWLDTGMSENEKANPLFGGMLEKTILNIVGDEFGVALLPQKENRIDFLAIARIAPGSDFLLNMALSSAKNIEKTDTEQRIFYRIRTKDSYFPSVIIHIQDNLAYASNSFQRLKQAYSGEGTGPKFLAESPTEGIPEDTILFMQLEDPEIRGLLHGTSQDYRFAISDTPAVMGIPPDVQKNASEVVRIQTNGAGFIGQPSGTYLLQSIDGKLVSALLLGFSNLQEPAAFEERLVAHMNVESREAFETNGIHCLRNTSEKSEEFLCRRGASLLLAQGQFALGQAKFQNDPPSGKVPFVLNIDFQKDAIRDYHNLMQRRDWSRFHEASAFYFLSCIRQISGGIDEKNREIVVEIE